MNNWRILFALLFLLAFSGTASAERENAVGETFRDELRSGGSGPELVVIPSGRFVLGGWPVGQTDLGLVKIAYRLAIGVTEVTRGQYRQFPNRGTTSHQNILLTKPVLFDDGEYRLTHISAIDQRYSGINENIG